MSDRSVQRFWTTLTWFCQDRWNHCVKRSHLNARAVWRRYRDHCSDEMERFCCLSRAIRSSDFWMIQTRCCFCLIWSMILRSRPCQYLRLCHLLHQCHLCTHQKSPQDKYLCSRYHVCLKSHGTLENCCNHFPWSYSRMNCHCTFCFCHSECCSDWHLACGYGIWIPPSFGPKCLISPLHCPQSGDTQAKAGSEAGQWMALEKEPSSHETLVCLNREILACLKTEAPP